MAERECIGCNQTFSKDSFSKGQWKKGAKARCKTCTASSSGTEPQSDDVRDAEPVAAQPEEPPAETSEDGVETDGGTRSKEDETAG